MATAPPRPSQSPAAGRTHTDYLARGLLAGMRIRKKLFVLHTAFSLFLAALLALALRPAVRDVVRDAEMHESLTVLSMVMSEGSTDDAATLAARTARWRQTLGPGSQLETLGPREVNLSEEDRTRLEGLARDGLSAAQPLVLDGPSNVPVLFAFHSPSGHFLRVSLRLDAARRGVIKLYILTTIALLSVYGLVAAALEIFVLPRQVYGPIGAMLDADQAVRDGRESEQVIPDAAIPRDELGEIMRSRNGAILAIRRHERDLAEALARLEEVAADLKRKNYLLEMARQNLADAGRLASLGMMSAGLAHEMNTPLAVLKGLTEKLTATEAARSDGSLSAGEIALMRRVVGRLERLSESLLHLARVRPMQSRPTPLRNLVDEAWLLVTLDRRPAAAAFINEVPADVVGMCDPDRMIQVFVNLLRNALDACSDSSNVATPSIRVAGGTVEREGARWASIRIQDNGPGIAAELMHELFQPFASTRLDSHGTGLGLAVSEGIVREHGGVIVAQNLIRPAIDATPPAPTTPDRRSERSADESPTSSGSPRLTTVGGAVFEILIPAAHAACADTSAMEPPLTGVRRDSSLENS